MTIFPTIYAMTIAAIGLSIAVGSCQTPHEAKPNSTLPEPLQPNDFFWADIRKDQVKRVGFLSKIVCEPHGDLARSKWEIPLITDFGRQKVFLAFHPKFTKVTIESAEYQLATEINVDNHVSDLCHQIKQNRRLTESSPQLVDAIHQVIHKAVPDCPELTLEAKGWRCEIPHARPQTVIDHLDGVTQTMIRRWNRQPYILTRRLFLTRMLAQTLQAEHWGAKLDQFCQIIHLSLPEELPATMASKKWQDFLCRGLAPNRRKVALIGMTKAMAEIDTLKKLFRVSSPRGLLRISIPRQMITTRDLWVTLTPRKNVKSNLLETTAKLWDDAQIPNVCWHPLFGDDLSELHRARFLGLTGHTPASQCPPVEPEHHTLTSNYLADSVASETEFVVSNGHSKLLSLPEGEYSYKIQEFSGDPTAPPKIDPTSTSSGMLAWQGRRPRAVIRTF